MADKVDADGNHVCIIAKNETQPPLIFSFSLFREGSVMGRPDKRDRIPALLDAMVMTPNYSTAARKVGTCHASPGARNLRLLGSIRPTRHDVSQASKGYPVAIPAPP